MIALFAPTLSQAAETICAQVKIEIKQELTLERQAFDAQMNINNTTADGVIKNVSVEVKVTDENGTPIAVSDNPNDQNAQFLSGSPINKISPILPATVWLIRKRPGLLTGC